MANATVARPDCVTALKVVDEPGAGLLLNLDLATLPSGFPAQLDTALAWKGTDFADKSDHILMLDETDRAEIASAVEHFKSLDLDGDAVGQENFPLPTLGLKLAAVGRELYAGKGFGLIRGIRPAEYSVEDLTLASLGIQSYVAEQLGRQDSRGNMLVHIVAEKGSKHHRHSDEAITFHHEEAGDVIGWLTRGSAPVGGACVIASSHTVFNVLAATRPDLIRVLARADWPFALPRFHCRPIVFHEDGKLMMNFGRAPLTGNLAHPRPAHLPSLTERQVEALDAIEAIARATEFKFETRPGDIHFINNLAVLHRREGFTNGQAPAEGRHLVRTRLRSAELGWRIPDPLAEEWEKAFGKSGAKAFHVEPMPGHFFPLRCPN